jgi:teichuronic acid biosynthesis glycosyltransferase TuaG
LKVSIVIPVYNAEKYLHECISSALSQSYSDIEIIAVDDGSTDNSQKILREYSNKITLISKKNGGTATALNTGIKAMTGEWFKWLSADDALKDDAISSLIDATKRLSDAKSTILYSHYDLIDNNGNKMGEFIEPNYNNLTDYEKNVILLDNYFGNGTTSLIHKSMFDRFGLFNETIGFHEDYEFWLRCCLLYNCKLHLVDKNLAKYRVHENQLTKEKINEALTHAQYVRNLILDKLEPSTKNQYEESLKKYRKQKPLKIRIRRKARDIMINVLPKSTSDRIIQSYLKRKYS